MASVNVGWWANNRPILLGYGRRLGETRDQPVYLAIDASTRGMHVVGGSGGGKSVLLENLAFSHVQAGRGLLQIDAEDLNKNTLARIAEVALPGTLTQQKSDRLGDKLIVVDLANQEFGCPSYNFLQTQPGRQTFELVDSMVALLQEKWPEMMGRGVDISRNSLLCLAEHGLTLAEMPLFLTDSAVRNALVRRSRNADVKLAFAQISGLRENDQRMVLESSRNKWVSFSSSPFVRPFIGQTHSTLNWRRIIDSGKIVLLILNRAHLMHESRAVLGAMFLNVLHAAALSRENVPREQRYYFAIIIDELPVYYTRLVDELVEGCRKYGIAFCAAHQSTRQNPFAQNRGAIDTLIANCHTRVSFGVGRQDAERMAAEYFTPSGQQIKYQDSLLGLPTQRAIYYSMGEEMQANVTELMHQQPGEGYVSFRGLSDDHRPYLFKARMLPPPPTHPEKIDALMRHVAATYYRPLDVINREIEARHERLQAMAMADAERPDNTLTFNDFTR